MKNMVTTTSGDLSVTIDRSDGNGDESQYPINIKLDGVTEFDLTKSEAKFLYIILDNFLNHVESSNPPPDQL